ncbi:MAG: hypothetical protein IPK22_11345 [Verrucomicrobiaceae bacterium]|nr:hypothetical protein [Verrucomicrobiaceae bacterium]
METKPTPIRLPSDLLSEVEAATLFTGLSQQEVMRLAMRIGLVDLRAAKDIAAVIQEAATDKGASFLAYARQQLFRTEAQSDDAAPLPPRQEITDYRASTKKKPRPPIAGGGGGSALDGRMVAEEHEK